MSAAADVTVGKTAAVPSDFPGQPLWSFPKRGGLVIASERAFKGVTFVDLRWWADAGKVPTGKGVSFPPEMAGELAAALLAYAKAQTEPYKT
jgi:hypothetical protein